MKRSSSPEDTAFEIPEPMQKRRRHVARGSVRKDHERSGPSEFAEELRRRLEHLAQEQASGADIWKLAEKMHSEVEDSYCSGSYCGESDESGSGSYCLTIMGCVLM